MTTEAVASSTRTTPWRPAMRPAMSPSIAVDTFQRNLIAVAERSLGLLRRLVVDTQEPMVNMHTWMDQTKKHTLRRVNRTRPVFFRRRPFGGHAEGGTANSPETSTSFTHHHAGRDDRANPLSWGSGKAEELISELDLSRHGWIWLARIARDGQQRGKLVTDGDGGGGGRI